MKHTPIDWVEQNAGFIPGVYDTGRQVINANRQIQALAIFRGVDYREMYDELTADFWEWMERPGRRSKTRRRYGAFTSFHTYRVPAEFYKQWLGERYLWVPLTRIGTGTVIRLDDNVFGNETVLARCSSDELIPVINNVAYYPVNPNEKWLRLVRDGDAPPENNTRAVYGYWTEEN